MLSYVCAPMHQILSSMLRHYNYCASITVQLMQHMHTLWLDKAWQYKPFQRRSFSACMVLSHGYVPYSGCWRHSHLQWVSWWPQCTLAVQPQCEERDPEHGMKAPKVHKPCQCALFAWTWQIKNAWTMRRFIINSHSHMQCHAFQKIIYAQKTHTYVHNYINNCQQTERTRFRRELKNVLKHVL